MAAAPPPYTYDPDERFHAPAPALHSTPPSEAERARWAALLAEIPDPEPSWTPGDPVRAVWEHRDDGSQGWRLEPVDPETGAPTHSPLAFYSPDAGWVDPLDEPDLARWSWLLELPASRARTASLDTGATTRHSRSRDDRDLDRLRSADALKAELVPVVRRAAGVEASRAAADESAANLERAAWLDARATAMAGCREVRAYREATCGAYIARPASCRVRVCPDCERARSNRLVARLDALTLDMRHPAFWTLTVPNVADGQLDRGVDWLLDAFRALRRRAVIRGGRCRDCRETHAPVPGGVYSIEVTRGVDGSSWHPHVHALMDATYIRWAEMRDAWRAVTCDAIRKLERSPSDRRRRLARCKHLADDKGRPLDGCRGASIVWVERVHGEPGSPERRAAIRETLKYATGGLVKDGKLAAGVTPDSLGELLLALRNRRLVAGWGEWRHVHDRDEDDELPDDLTILVETGAENRLGMPVYERMPAKCPCCGTTDPKYELPVPVPRVACRPRDGTLTWRPPPVVSGVH